MREYTLYSYNFELQTQRYNVKLAIPYNYFLNKKTDLPYLHYHAKYEVVYVQYLSGSSRGKFVVIPPFFKHYTYDEAAEIFVTTFQFSLEDRTEASMPPKSDAFHSIASLKEPAEIADVFEGSQRMSVIWNELRERRYAYIDIISAELHLILLNISRLIALEHTGAEPPKRSLDDVRLDIIDSFFSDNYMNQDCHRADLAKLLNISEKQLSRILHKHFDSNFSKMLTNIRMEKADGILKKSRITAEKMAGRVGYRSTSAFLSAYKKHFGFSYYETNY